MKEISLFFFSIPVKSAILITIDHNRKIPAIVAPAAPRTNAIIAKPITSIHGLLRNTFCFSSQLPIKELTPASSIAPANTSAGKIIRNVTLPKPADIAGSSCIKPITGINTKPIRLGNTKSIKIQPYNTPTNKPNAFIPNGVI